MLFVLLINSLHSTLNANTKGIRWLVFVILLLFLGCLSDFCLTSAPPSPPAAHGCADLPVCQSESMHSFAQIPNPCPEAPVDTRQQERYDPRTQKTERTSPVMLPSPTRFSSAAAANTELQHQSRCSLEAEHISNDRCSGRPEQHKASEAIPKISMGRCYAFYPALYAFVAFVVEHNCFVMLCWCHRRKSSGPLEFVQILECEEPGNNWWVSPSLHNNPLKLLLFHFISLKRKICKRHCALIRSGLRVGVSRAVSDLILLV